MSMQSYWNKNRVAAAAGDTTADNQKQRLYVDVTDNTLIDVSAAVRAEVPATEPVTIL
jgi:hypothetical protein